MGHRERRLRAINSLGATYALEAHQNARARNCYAFSVRSAGFARSVPAVFRVLLLTACGGGGGSVIPPFWSDSGLVVEDLNGDGLNDIVVNDGPSVLLQRADAPGSFAALRPLR